MVVRDGKARNPAPDSATIRIWRDKGNRLQVCPALAGRSCKNRPVPPKPSHGDVEITLQWKDRNDLDLHCVEPNGDTINFTNLISLFIKN